MTIKIYNTQTSWLENSDIVGEKFIISGFPGSGKTTQMITLPGKTFGFMLDPVGAFALKGYNIDIKQYFKTEVETSIKSNKKGVKSIKVAEFPKAYSEFSTDIEDFFHSGQADEYDNVFIDSITTLQNMIMDTILYDNGRYGQAPELRDYMTKMSTLRRVFEFATYQKKQNIFFIAHDVIDKDEITKKITNHLHVGKGARAELPTMVNHYIRCTCEGKDKFFIQTLPDYSNESLRSSWNSLGAKINVTIKDFKNPQNYGIGKILKEMKR